MNKGSKPSGFVILLIIVIWISSFMIQTTLWVLKENNAAIVLSFLWISISISYIVVDSFLVRARRVMSWGMQVKFQLTTNFPWRYCMVAWSSSKSEKLGIDFGQSNYLSTAHHFITAVCSIHLVILQTVMSSCFHYYICCIFVTVSYRLFKSVLN